MKINQWWRGKDKLLIKRALDLSLPETQTPNQFPRQIAPDNILDLYPLTLPKTYPDDPLYPCEGCWVEGWTALALDPSFNLYVLVWVPSAEAH